MALRAFSFFAGAVVAVALIGAGVTWYRYGTLEGLFAGFTLPQDLNDAYFLYQEGGKNTLYHLENGMYTEVSLGTTLPTVALSRRENHIASLQRASTGAYEVRTDATLRYSSPQQKFHVAVSPDGRQAAFAEASIESVQQAHERNEAAFATQVMVLDERNEPVSLGAGFAPFFISNDQLAWFTREGLMMRTLPQGTTTVLAADIRPLPPPYPGPTVSRDGRLIAWSEPDAHAIHIGLVTPTGVQRISSYTEVRSPYITLSASRLYSVVPSKIDTGVFSHAFRDDEKGTRVYGFPNKGILVQFAP